MLHARIAQSHHPHTIHLLPSHEHLSTALREIYVPGAVTPDGLHVRTSFAWLGHGTILHRSEAIDFLKLLKHLNVTEDEMKMADNYYTVLKNRVPEVWFDQGIELGGGQPFTIGLEGDSRNARHILRATRYLKFLLGSAQGGSPLPYTSTDHPRVPEHITRAACKSIPCLLETNIHLLPDDDLIHTSESVDNILKLEETNLRTLSPDRISHYIAHPPSRAVDDDPLTFFESPSDVAEGDYITLRFADGIPTQETVDMAWTVDAGTERIILHALAISVSQDGEKWCPVTTKMQCSDPEPEGGHTTNRKASEYSGQTDPRVTIARDRIRNPQRFRQCIIQMILRSSPPSPVGGDNFTAQSTTTLGGCGDGYQFATGHRQHCYVEGIRYVRAEVQRELRGPGVALPHWKVHEISIQV